MAGRDHPRVAGGRLDAFCGRRAPVLLAAMCVAWTALFGWHVLLKHRFYLYTDIDCALFVQIVDGILHGRFYSSIRGMNWLGDHSSLILFLVAPLYALFRHPTTLPLLQCAVLALGALPVWFLARRIAGGGFVPLGFAALYLLYPALGYTALYEFHPEVLCTPLLLAMIASYRADRLGLTLLFAGLSLLGKEDMALPVVALAGIALIDRRPRRGAYVLALGGLAAASLLLSFAVLKPAFGAGEVEYGIMYEQWGKHPGEVVASLVRHPLRALAAFFTTPNQVTDTLLKRQYYVHMLLPLLFLPLAAPRALAIALPTLATHFLSWRPAQHTIYYQYTAAITPFVVTASVIGFSHLLRRFGPRRGLGAAATVDVPLGERPIAHATMVAMLAASVLANWMFGPLTGHTQLQAAVSEEAIAPTGHDRALTRERDRMMAMLGRRDSVVAGFEFLMHLARHRHVHSLHNTVEGRHTFSRKPYPMLDDVTGLIADMSHSRLRPYGNQGTAGRLAELRRRNRLGLVSVAGDLMLFLRDAPDSANIWAEGELPIAQPQRVTFDGQLAFLGNELLSRTVAPGGQLPFRTFWRKVAPTDSLYVLQFTGFDALGRSAFATMRYLGYMIHPAGEWPDTTMVCETYRMIVPDDVPPGEYMLGMRVGRRDRLDQVLCEIDDPRVRAQSNVVELGRFTVTR